MYDNGQNTDLYITSCLEYKPMMNCAFWTAALVQSTPGPKEQNPCLSIGLTEIKATSRFNSLRRNNSGISLRKMGMVSALPSSTAFLIEALMKNELGRKIPAKCNILTFIQYRNILFKKYISADKCFLWFETKWELIFIWI